MAHRCSDAVLCGYSHQMEYARCTKAGQYVQESRLCRLDAFERLQVRDAIGGEGGQRQSAGR